jgi:hypothetical protein
MYIDPLILDRQLVPLPNFTDYIFFSFGTLHSSKKMLHEYVAMAENCTWQSRYAVRTAWRSILEEIHEFFLRRMFETLFVPSGWMRESAVPTRGHMLKAQCNI